MKVVALEQRHDFQRALRAAAHRARHVLRRQQHRGAAEPEVDHLDEELLGRFLVVGGEEEGRRADRAVDDARLVQPSDHLQAARDHHFQESLARGACDAAVQVPPRARLRRTREARDRREPFPPEDQPQLPRVRRRRIGERARPFLAEGLRLEQPVSAEKPEKRVDLRRRAAEDGAAELERARLQVLVHSQLSLADVESRREEFLEEDALAAAEQCVE
mmetsp:Transcript_1173/g.2863  ORF Transcript_1173/g.2863 Transcript_1173/m.2863 type:complete len:218 (+) Transcript_1173:654-1307(+)